MQAQYTSPLDAILVYTEIHKIVYSQKIKPSKIDPLYGTHTSYTPHTLLTYWENKAPLTYWENKAPLTYWENKAPLTYWENKAPLTYWENKAPLTYWENKALLAHDIGGLAYIVANHLGCQVEGTSGLIDGCTDGVVYFHEIEEPLQYRYGISSCCA